MKVTVERHVNADSRWVISVRCFAISVQRTRLLEFKIATSMTIDFFQMVQGLLVFLLIIKPSDWSGVLSGVFRLTFLSRRQRE